tara:strand:+ start:964 stop:1839 length:876 start_codon:yes stop_codon:yes gene_type:complete
MSKKALTLEALCASAWKRFWEGTKNAPTIRSNIKKILATFGEQQAVHRMTTAMIENACSRWVAEGSSEKTCNRRLSCLSKMLKSAERRGEIKSAPYIERFTEGQGRLRYASEEEEAAMIAALNDAGYAQFARVVALLADTGLRRSELLSMKWDQLEDMEWGTGVIRLDETKNGRMRKVPLTRRAQHLMKESTDSFALEALDGPFRNIYPSTFADVWNRMKVRIGLEGDGGFTPHCLRHAFACRLLQRGARIEVVSRLLGHDDIGTTINRYYHESPGDCQSAVDLLEPGGAQ